MPDDDFELWLGRIGKDPGLRASLRRVVNLAGGAQRGRSRSGFTGARSGRGSGIGRLLGSSAGRGGGRARRVVVKARVMQLAGKGAGAAAAHLRYLRRDGTTREGTRGALYGALEDDADGKAFLARGTGDRHQFRFIVAAEDGADYGDLKPLTQRLMAQAEQDLGTRLDWVAVDHFNTGHPHTHILVRGKDDRGHDLVIAREYIARGLRERASELVNLDLGPRSAREIARADRREIAQERFTPIDRRLLHAVDGEGLVAPHHRDRHEQSLRAGRIGTLVRMGLATPSGHMRWRLDENLESILRAMGRRGDIIATLDHAVRTEQLAIAPANYTIHDPGAHPQVPIIGRVVARGLAEDDDERSYLIVDAIDGQAHYVDIGIGDGSHGPLGDEAIVRVSPVPIKPRAVDRTVSAIAAANGGYYSAELHALHDPGAGEAFVAAHVRRLEALRRIAHAADRGADGLWRIAPDHEARALAHDRERGAAQPVVIAVLADRPLDQLARHDGITALDEDPDLASDERLGAGFGRKVAAALQQRRAWLIEQGLSDRPDRVEVLRRRELVRVTAGLSRQLGLALVETPEHGRVQGTYRQSVQVGALRMAVIDGGSGFALVPWRRALERQLGREVSGRVRGNDVSWSFGRTRTRGPER